MRQLLIHGMHGMGDNIHQRAIIRQLIEWYEVWLESSWFSLYHDLVGDRLHIIRKATSLRTQKANQQREAAKFWPGPMPKRDVETRDIRYGRHNTSLHPSGTVLAAMCLSAGVDYERADYRLPVPSAWFDEVDRYIESWRPTKPLLIYRPLVERPEWRGGGLRNADPAAYALLIEMIRDQFFVVSVADLKPSLEWIVGPEFKADAILHQGELAFESLAAMFARASLVFTSGGFGGILAPAVGTPAVSILGGYEPVKWQSSGARFAPWLGLGPTHPCSCGTSGCRLTCDKRLDLPKAIAQIQAFVATLTI
jgi:hypothetical protein